jgi:hypothetical protein
MNEEMLKHVPMKASDRDEKSPVWDMSQERQFIENLLSQRFNYFLLFYSITIAGFVNSKNLFYAQAILTFGAVIVFLFASVLQRSQQKLDIILTDLFKDESHPAKIIDDLAGGSKGSKRRIIGYWIPLICSWTLIIGAIVHLCYIICTFNCQSI